MKKGSTRPVWRYGHVGVATKQVTSLTMAYVDAFQDWIANTKAKGLRGP